jgi:hypothetical protein
MVEEQIPESSQTAEGGTPAEQITAESETQAGSPSVANRLDRIEAVLERFAQLAEGSSQQSGSEEPSAEDKLLVEVPEEEEWAGQKQVAEWMNRGFGTILKRLGEYEKRDTERIAQQEEEEVKQTEEDFKKEHPELRDPVLWKQFGDRMQKAASSRKEFYKLGYLAFDAERRRSPQRQPGATMPSKTIAGTTVPVGKIVSAGLEADVAKAKQMAKEKMGLGT